jgi:homogentisate 1,2-dioxygenase
MIGHGPDAESYEKAVTAEQKPFKTPEDGISFMFESGYMLKSTKWTYGEFLAQQ